MIARVSVEELESENVGCFGEGDNILFIVALPAFYRHKLWSNFSNHYIPFLFYIFTKLIGANHGLHTSGGV